MNTTTERSVTEYRIGKNLVRVHGVLKYSPRLEKAVQDYMKEVLKVRKGVKR